MCRNKRGRKRTYSKYIHIYRERERKRFPFKNNEKRERVNAGERVQIYKYICHIFYVDREREMSIYILYTYRLSRE